jgi:hypothetical protein
LTVAACDIYSYVNKSLLYAKRGDKLTILNPDVYPIPVKNLINNLKFDIRAISSNEEILDVSEDEKKAFQTILKNVI